MNKIQNLPKLIYYVLYFLNKILDIYYRNTILLLVEFIIG